MASVFRILFPDFAPPATVENAGARPVPSPVIDDPEEYDREIEEAFERAEEKLADTGDGDRPSPASS